MMMSLKLPWTASSDELLNSGNAMSMSSRGLDDDLQGVRESRPAEHWHNVTGEFDM